MASPLVALAQSQAVVWIAFWGGVSVIALTLVLLAAILLVRAIQMVKEARHQKVVEEWRPMLICSLDPRGDAPERVPRLRKRDAIPVLLLWNYYQQSLRGESVAGLNDIARRGGFAEAARQLLDSRSVRRRLLAVETLGHLGDVGSWDDLEELLYTTNTYVSMAAARALLRLHPREAMSQVVEQMSRRADWVPNTAMGMLREVGPEIVSEFLPHATINCSDDFKPLMLLYLQSAHSNVVIPVVRQVMEDTDDQQIITTCIYLIGLVANPRGLPLIRRFLNHKNWKIRLHCCSALGRFGTEHDVDNLVARLSDTEYWVRYRAAQAVASLPFMTDARLHDIQGELKDRYARDILTQVIAEREDRHEEAAAVRESGGAA